ncbi:acyltransferase [Actinoplanes sichuanensis]|uniref:Acyltransferase n=1 Tax=Actinoplanes sichuanensis TaxID=512349 RepID=A0ABW4AFG9_9ACTN|nr:acyltransferase [Actinoplanes sichuanensis]BEL02504.1 acyltransferase [Actinoplanes sichuanensis]
MRNRYLDTLRAAAIVRVVVYHHFGWAWLSLALPAMGVMFAVAGSLTAASLDRRAAGPVVLSRLRRLLPPLWLLGAVVVPAMITTGWTVEPARLLLWIVPLADPPGSEAAIDAWEPLWYIRAYLWFVLLTPLLYGLWKRVGWALVALPIAGLVVLDKTGFTLPDAADSAMWDLVTYGACWIVGFAHRDGRLARLHPAIAFWGAIGLGAAALYWQSGHQGEDAWDLNDVSESQALWSLAFVLLVLRWQPDMTRFAAIRPLDRLVSLLNGRAVTIYLWHNIAIAAIWPVLEFTGQDDLGRLEGPVTLAMTVLLTGVAVVAFGWVEDLAAGRSPRLWPTYQAPRAQPAAGETPGERRTAGETPGERQAVPEPSAGDPITERIIRDTPPGAPCPPQQGRRYLSEDPVTERIMRDMPVAGRPPVQPRGHEGVPWAGNTAPQQGGPPLPLRFDGRDGAH